MSIFMVGHGRESGALATTGEADGSGEARHDVLGEVVEDMGSDALGRERVWKDGLEELRDGLRWNEEGDERRNEDEERSRECAERECVREGRGRTCGQRGRAHWAESLPWRCQVLRRKR